MALVVDSSCYYFQSTDGSPFIYCTVPFYFPKPWRAILVRFGSQNAIAATSIFMNSTGKYARKSAFSSYEQ